MAYLVTQRAQEIAVRLALGAGATRIRNMVVMQGLVPVIVGMVAGVAAAVGLTRLLSSVLYRVQPLDPVVFVVSPAILVSVALCAIWLPASRASRVDPNRSLRSE
jgi:ABC-type antimicrobial peptide transport system permease subunit